MYKGMNVAELCTELGRIPQHYECRLGIALEQDVPFTRENIDPSGIMQTVTFVPLAVDYAADEPDDEVEENPKPIIRKKPVASSDETPVASQHDGEGTLEVKNIVLCTECRRVFIPGKETKVESVLPCGHKPDVWMLASCIVDNDTDANFLDWMDVHGHLDGPILALEEEGGSFDPGKIGAERLVLPKE